MTQVKAWKDDDGYALEFEDNRIEITEEGLTVFIDQLRRLQEMNVDETETLNTEFCLDLMDE